MIWASSLIDNSGIPEFENEGAARTRSWGLTPMSLKEQAEEGELLQKGKVGLTYSDINGLTTAQEGEAIFQVNIPFYT